MRAPEWNDAQAASTQAASDASTPTKPRIRPKTIESAITASSTRSVGVIAASGMRPDGTGDAELRLRLHLQALGLDAGRHRAQAHAGQRALVRLHRLEERAETGAARAVAQRRGVGRLAECAQLHREAGVRGAGL